MYAQYHYNSTNNQHSILIIKIYWNNLVFNRSQVSAVSLCTSAYRLCHPISPCCCSTIASIRYHHVPTRTVSVIPYHHVAASTIASIRYHHVPTRIVPAIQVSTCTSSYRPYQPVSQRTDLSLSYKLCNVPYQPCSLTIGHRFVSVTPPGTATPSRTTFPSYPTLLFRTTLPRRIILPFYCDSTINNHSLPL